LEATGASDSEFSLDVALPVTTLEVQIAVKDSNAQAVSGANLTIGGERNAQLLTDVLGEAKWLTTVGKSTATLQLTFEARFGAYLARSTQTINLTLGQKTSLNLELRLLQIDPGTLRWQFATGGAIEQPPALGSDGTIYVGSRDRKLYAINPNGTERWSYTTGAEVIASPVVREDGSVLVSSSDNTITALEPTGTRRWVYTGTHPFELAPSVAFDGSLYAVDGAGTLHAISSGGQPLWSANLGVAKAVPVVASDGAVVVGTETGLSLFNSDGSVRFVATLAAKVLSMALDAESRIYAMLENGKLVRLSKTAQFISEQTYANSQSGDFKHHTQSQPWWDVCIW
jgi:outer membrane protein assembly factor BamB